MNRVALTNIAVDLVIIDCVIRIITIVVAVGGVVIVFVLLNLRLLRVIVGVGGWRRLFNSESIKFKF